ncbi:MAG: DUF2179 domain-containing protein [Sedimentibacter sp.]
MELLFNLSGPALYITIFIAKIIEVTISTVRLVLINKGERVKGALLAFVEIMIWLIVVSSVLNNITQDPIKMFVYAIAFSLGNYIGVTIESKIAVGLASIQVVVFEANGEEMANVLRDKGFGVTIIGGRGKNDSLKSLLFIQLKRKRIPEAVNLIKQTNSAAFITVNDIKSIMGGYFKK